MTRSIFRLRAYRIPSLIDTACSGGVEENTSLKIGDRSLTEGKAWFNVNSPLEVTTPNASLTVRGTVFSVEHIANMTRVAVFEGTVRYTAPCLSKIIVRARAVVAQDGAWWGWMRWCRDDNVQLTMET
jgi:hypothetical protein